MWGVKLLREESLCSGPAAYKSSSSGSSSVFTYKLPVGALPGAPIHLYSKGFSAHHLYHTRYQCEEMLAHGVIHSVQGLQASIGWLRMVHRSTCQALRGGPAHPPALCEPEWQVGNLASGGMDAFREVTLGGPHFQLIPIFRWEAPEEAVTLLETIREERALPVQITQHIVSDGHVLLSLALLNGQQFDVKVAAGVPVFEVTPQILEAVQRGPEETSEIKWSLHLVMLDGRLLQPHDLLPGSSATAGHAVAAAEITSS